MISYRPLNFSQWMHHMIQMTLSQLATILGLKHAPVNTEFHGISIDTRTLQPGNLFIAILGDNVDGHDFIENAREKGASAALVTRTVDSSLPQLLVDDIVIALGK